LLNSCEVWSFREDRFSDFEASTTVVLASCAASALPTLSTIAQPSLPLSWLNRARVHEPGAATATHRLGGAPTANSIPRDDLWQHAKEIAEAQPPLHRVRDVELTHNRSQATLLTAADPLHAHAQPSNAQASKTSSPTPSLPTLSPPTPN